MDNLKRRRLTLVNRYFMGKGEEESGKHIFLRRSKARILWQIIFSLIGIVWVPNSSIKTALLS